MPKKCELTGKRPLKGHKVSHANNKVKRRFLPSVKKVSFKSELLNKKLILLGLPSKMFVEKKINLLNNFKFFEYGKEYST